MTVREVPYDGFSAYEFTRGERPRSLRELAAENWGFADSSDVLKKVAETPVSEPNSKTVTSRIRVYLSRPLTWAEKEELETDYEDLHLRRVNGQDGFKVWVSPNLEHVWAEAEFGSRLLYEIVASELANEFVNVYPKAVRTFREYNGE